MRFAPFRLGQCVAPIQILLQFKSFREQH